MCRRTSSQPLHDQKSSPQQMEDTHVWTRRRWQTVPWREQWALHQWGSILVSLEMPSGSCNAQQMSGSCRWKSCMICWRRAELSCSMHHPMTSMSLVPCDMMHPCNSELMNDLGNSTAKKSFQPTKFKYPQSRINKSVSTPLKKKNENPLCLLAWLLAVEGLCLHS